MATEFISDNTNYLVFTRFRDGVVLLISKQGEFRCFVYDGDKHIEVPDFNKSFRRFWEYQRLGMQQAWIFGSDLSAFADYLIQQGCKEIPALSPEELIARLTQIALVFTSPFEVTPLENGVDMEGGS